MTRERGFSLTEVMVVLLVSGIILASGVPAFLSFQRGLSNVQARERMMQDIRYARQLAVTRHQSVIIAFGDGVTTTDITTYTLHVDADNDRVVDVGEWTSGRTLPRGVLLTSVALAPTDSLIFDPSGALWPGTNGGRLVYTNGRTPPDTIMISGVGMVYNP
jgi:prepilin-type N-terminal cleavage/methylation domain-containing protein